MNTALAQKYQETWMNIVTFGIQCFFLNDLEQSKRLAAAIREREGFSVIKKIRGSRILIDPQKTLLVFSCPNESPEDWSNKSKDERRNIAIAKRQNVKLLEPNLDGVADVLFIGDLRRHWVTALSESYKDVNFWFFGKTNNHDFLVHHIDFSEEGLTINLKPYTMRHYSHKESSEPIPPKLYFVCQDKYFDTGISSLHIPYKGRIMHQISTAMMTTPTAVSASASPVHATLLDGAKATQFHDHEDHDTEDVQTVSVANAVDAYKSALLDGAKATQFHEDEYHDTEDVQTVGVTDAINAYKKHLDDSASAGNSDSLFATSGDQDLLEFSLEGIEGMQELSPEDCYLLNQMFQEPQSPSSDASQEGIVASENRASKKTGKRMRI